MNVRNNGAAGDVAMTVRRPVSEFICYIRATNCTFIWHCCPCELDYGDDYIKRMTTRDVEVREDEKAHREQ